MVDRPPRSRFSIVERGGRLVVIDNETGKTPLSAAERMEIHDRKMGVEPNRPAARQAAPAPAAPDAAPPREAPRPPNDRMAEAIARMNRKQPWSPKAKDAAATTHPPAAARPPGSPAPQTAGGHKTIVTGKWWDAKGPRSVDLSPKGQQLLGSSFVTLFFVIAVAAITALFVAPVIFFIGGFLLFRFGGTVAGPIGASIIDKALAEKG